MHCTPSLSASSETINTPSNAPANIETMIDQLAEISLHNSQFNNAVIITNTINRLIKLTFGTLRQMDALITKCRKLIKNVPKTIVNIDAPAATIPICTSIFKIYANNQSKKCLRAI